MEIGNRIRFYRVQQSMTQEELAKGIISVSYLSKIENQQTSASLEVLDMLCEKLGIKLIEEEEATLSKDLFDWYYMILQKNRAEAADMHTKLSGIIPSTNDSTAFIYFVLFELRYFILLQQMDKANEQLAKINEFKDIFDSKMSYYYFKFLALYNYIRNKYSVALDTYKKAEMILNKNIHFEKWEEADLYYSIGLTCSQLGKVPSALNYGRLALSIYQSLYNFRRCAECQILLGICYLRTEEYQLSEESYILAERVADSLNDRQLKGVIHHNLGYLYSIQENHAKAIEAYETCLPYKAEHPPSKLSTIFGLIREYYKSGDFENCRKWITEGFSILENAPEKNDFHLHFKIYDYLIDGPSAEFERFMDKEAFPYFQEKENFQSVIEYSEILGKYYEERNKYKLSSLYYLNAVKALKKHSYKY